MRTRLRLELQVCFFFSLLSNKYDVQIHHEGNANVYLQINRLRVWPSPARHHLPCFLLLISRVLRAISIDFICAQPCQSPLLQWLSMILLVASVPKRPLISFSIMVSGAVAPLMLMCMQVDHNLGINSIRVHALTMLWRPLHASFLCA